MWKGRVISSPVRMAISFISTPHPPWTLAGQLLPGHWGNIGPPHNVTWALLVTGDRKLDQQHPLISSSPDAPLCETVPKDRFAVSELRYSFAKFSCLFVYLQKDKSFAYKRAEINEFLQTIKLIAFRNHIKSFQIKIFNLCSFPLFQPSNFQPFN